MLARDYSEHAKPVLCFVTFSNIFILTFELECCRNLEDGDSNHGAELELLEQVFILLCLVSNV